MDAMKATARQEESPERRGDEEGIRPLQDASEAAFAAFLPGGGCNEDAG